MPTSPPLPLADIRRCAADQVFLTEVETLYAELDADISGRNPVCTNRGACCKFERLGHLLFVTPVELAYFLARAGGPTAIPKSTTCPYQQGGRCTARAGRPSGCRIFFCDPDAQGWQGPTTERTLARIREIHHRFELPYAYLEWLAALEQLAQDLTSPPPGP